VDPSTQGYNDGLQQGRDDAAGAHPYDPSRDPRFRYSVNAVYRNAYLQGYAAGYGTQAPANAQPPGQ
jgi:hypothetical protein